MTLELFVDGDRPPLHTTIHSWIFRSPSDADVYLVEHEYKVPLRIDDRRPHLVVSPRDDVPEDYVVCLGILLLLCASCLVMHSLGLALTRQRMPRVIEDVEPLIVPSHRPSVQEV